MKPVSQMSRLELAAWIGAALARAGVDVVLSGGSCVSIYSGDRYVSMDIDFVNVFFAKRSKIKAVMTALGFSEHNRYFKHPASELLVEFPPGPLGIGDEQAKQIDTISTETGFLRLLSPTDCVKDRLAWYYHDNDTECLEQAILVASKNPVDVAEIDRWSKREGKTSFFEQIKHRFIANLEDTGTAVRSI